MSPAPSVPVAVAVLVTFPRVWSAVSTTCWISEVQVTDAPGASPGAAGIGHATSPSVWSETARDVRSTLPVFVTRKL